MQTKGLSGLRQAVVSQEAKVDQSGELVKILAPGRTGIGNLYKFADLRTTLDQRTYVYTDTQTHINMYHFKLCETFSYG